MAKVKAEVDFYAVLGLNRECTDVELKSAYKKLALRWHPDRCYASGNSNFVEEAKAKFQTIQEAYSVLSDSSKRLLYDFGIYDSNEDQEGMSDFLSEMTDMMSQTKPSDNFEELQELFVDMFQEDLENLTSPYNSGGDSPTPEEDPLLWSCDPSLFNLPSMLPSPMHMPPTSYHCTAGNGLKRHCSDMVHQNVPRYDCSDFDELAAMFDSVAPAFSFEAGGPKRHGQSSRRSGRKQKVSSRHDVSSL